MMDFDSFANYIIESLITKEELNAIINHLIDSYDKTGRFFQLTNSRTILSKYSNNYNRIHKTLLGRAKEIIEEREKQSEYDFLEWDWADYIGSINIEKNTEMRLIIDDMSANILRRIESMALEKREERINHRFKVGSRIFLNEYEHSEYDNLIEFFHDGGWGVANKDGVVIISNHLITKASNNHPLFHPIISSYVTNQLYVSTDRDTELEGIISINPLKELLPCKYKIESMEGMRNGKYIYAFRALSKEGLWGCYNDYCKKIANFKYQTIEFNQGYVECGRNGIFHLQDNENGDGDWDTIFDGPKDLYDVDGRLILGGYTEFKYLERAGLFLFYFNTYKESYPYDVGWEGISIDKYKTCYDEAKCLILDKEFKPLLKDGNNDKNCIKGRTIDNIEEIPSTCLINGEILKVFDNHIVSKETEFVFKEYIDGTPYYETKEMILITYVSDNGLVKWKKAVDDYYG